MSDTILTPLIAAGGNSRFARSVRARLQWRDRFGRWIEMGRGVKFKVRGADGAPRSVIGSFVGAKDDKTGQVYVAKDPNGLPDGFYDVDSSNAQEFVANLDEAQLADRGIELGKDANGQAVGERASENIPNINEVRATAAPLGWEAIPGTFGGKKVIQTDDGDFRVHFGGKDETVLLEDHRAKPGVADPQRSVAEAFKRVGDVDIQREESGDQAYTGLAANNEEKLANRDRDSKIEQIKGNERTILNEKAPLGAKQSAMTANETLKGELEADGQAYDPDGFDSDEKLAARKNALETEAAPEAGTPTAPQDPNAPAPTAAAGELDLSTFEVAPEGFLVPTGKKTNDISRDGLGNFMTAEKEQLSKGGSRLVVDTDTGEAEIYNSADTLDDAQAQAGGIGVPQVLDLSTGQAVDVGEPNPNAGDPDVNLTGEKINAQDSNPDAVEPGTANPGADAPAQPEPAGENGQGGAPAASGADPSSPNAPDNGGTGTDSPTERPVTDEPAERPGGDQPATAPGSTEELKARRAKVQAALDNAGDPKDIIALNEQADALDTRIAAQTVPEPQPLRRGTTKNVGNERYSYKKTGNQTFEVSENGELIGTIWKTRNGYGYRTVDGRSDETRPGANRTSAATLLSSKNAQTAPTPDAVDESVDAVELPGQDTLNTPEGPLQDSEKLAELIQSLEVQQDRLQDEMERGASGRSDDEIGTDIDRVFDELADLQDKFDRLESGQDYNPEQEVETDLKGILDSAWAQTDPFPESWIEKRERAALRILRDGEKKGDLEAAKARLSQEEQDALTDDVAEALGIRKTAPAAPASAPTQAQVPAWTDETLPVETLQGMRMVSGTNEDHVNRLAEIYREQGFFGSPVMVSTGPNDSIIMDGNHRVEAASRAGLPEIPVRVYDNSDEGRSALNRALVEIEREKESSPDGPVYPENTPTSDPSTEIPEANDPFQAAFDAAEAERLRVVADPNSTEEDWDAAEARSDAAWSALNGTPTQPVDDPVSEPVEAPAATEPVPAEPIDVPEPAPALSRSQISEVTDELEEREYVESLIDPSESTGGLYEPGDDPYNVEPGHDNKVEAVKAKAQGKDLTPEERERLSEALDSGVLTDNQVARLSAQIDTLPNRSDTVTIQRPAAEQPDYMSTADVDIINAERNDPNFVFDEDLTWRRVREEFPNATELDNGDLILETTTNKGKRYDTIIRRTRKNRFMVYVMETDQKGNRRAKRIGDTEWHSYEALEKRIQQGRALINSKSPAGSLARRKDQPTENLGTQGFPSDDFIGDIGNPDAPLPETGDAKFDRLLQVAAEHIRKGDADIEGIEAHLQELDPGANAINTIMQAIIGRAQDNYRPDGVNPWQTYDGQTAEIGAEYDWTDWHQEKDWWLPNGQLNPNRKPNKNYGEVRRVRVMGYIRENTDGKGHTYGDHVWVSMQNSDGSWGNWTKRSAQTLRSAEPGSAPGLPFFSKREEWRTNPEALARRFRVPNAAPDEPVKTQPRPKGELTTARRLRFTSRGTLAGYSNTPVPTSQAEIAGMMLSGEITPSIAPARTARPGMIVYRRDEDGNQHADSIIRVENLGDGGYRIHAARPNGRGYADVDNFVVPGDADIALGTSPGLPAPRQPEPANDRQGELVSFDREGVPMEGVVVFDSGQGTVMVNTPSGETIDILESDISPMLTSDVSQEQRQDLLGVLEDNQIPQYIKNLIRQGVLSPGLSAERYQQLVGIAQAFEARTAEIRDVDVILDMINATGQQRADVYDFFTATETE